MVKNGVDFNSRTESSRFPAEEGEYDHIPVREYNGFKKRRRYVSVEGDKRTSYDGSNDPLTLSKEYEARRWYETKAVRDLIQTVSFHDDDNDYDDDNEWRQSGSPESDSVEIEHPRDYDKEIDYEDISEKLDHEDVTEPCLLSFEYFKRKWRKFRNLIDYCYPALSRKKEYYKCPFPCYPSRDRRSTLMPKAEHDDEDQLSDPSSTVEPPFSSPSPEDPKAMPEKLIEALDDEARPAGDVEVFDSSLGRKDRVEGPSTRSRKFLDESNRQIIVKSCCEDDDFWTTLFQILILAPLLAFTAYLFVQWYKTRQEYKKTLGKLLNPNQRKNLGKLNKLKRENENLVGAINRLDAFVMSCQMSPIVCVKRQRKLGDQVRRICQSLKNHKEKIKELEQDRAIYREVLWNLKTCA